MINHFFYKLIINCRLYLAHTCSISDPKNYWIALVTRNKTLLRLRSYGENLSQVERSLAYPSYPGRAMAMTVSYSSLQNLKNCLREKQNVGLAERLARLTRWPFSDGRVTLLAGPTRSKRDHQNMRELALLQALGWGKWVNYKCSLKLIRLEGKGDPFSRGNFSP